MIAKHLSVGVRITGWAWIVMGFLSLVSGVGSLLLFAITKQAQALDIASHTVLLETSMHVGQIAFSLIGAIAGIGLLRRKELARITLKVMCGCAILYACGYGAFAVVQASTVMIGRAPLLLMAVIVLLIIGVIAITTLPFVAMLIVLRNHRAQSVGSPLPSEVPRI